jgi:1,5-anhydro-D-fructose reductase (1,5-anhydro-D-mannitol-forming)
MVSMLNWVVVGIGDVTSKRVIPAILAEPRSCLYGVVSRDPEKGRRYAGRVWSDLDDALADPEVHAVYVATPVALHAPQTIAALHAAKHVLCEKPMAMDYAEARRMTRAARETGRTLGIAYYRRMYPKLHRAEINCHDWYTDSDIRRCWRIDPARAGGGPLYDIASHRIDVLNFLFGRPVAVAGQISNVVHATPVEDSATLLVEYEQGTRGVVDVRWHSRVARDEFRIIGTDGEMELSPLSGPELVWPGGREQLPCHANLHYPCVENFVSAVVDGAHLYSSGETAVWTDWVTGEALKGLPSGAR